VARISEEVERANQFEGKLKYNKKLHEDMECITTSLTRDRKFGGWFPGMDTHKVVAKILLKYGYFQNQGQIIDFCFSPHKFGRDIKIFVNNLLESIGK
jgi:hypothetical protein